MKSILIVWSSRYNVTAVWTQFIIYEAVAAIKRSYDLNLPSLYKFWKCEGIPTMYLLTGLYRKG